MTYTQTYQTYHNIPYATYSPNDIRTQVASIGKLTTFSNIPGKPANFNMSLIDNIVKQGAVAIPHLVNLLNKHY